MYASSNIQTVCATLFWRVTPNTVPIKPFEHLAHPQPRHAGIRHGFWDIAVGLSRGMPALCMSTFAILPIAGKHPNARCTPLRRATPHF
jgi:hypothetical protein